MKHKLTLDALQRKYQAKKNNAKDRDIKFTLSFKEYCHLFDTNNGYCDYTGLLMSFDHNSHSGQVADNYATLERIDEDKNIGYVSGNVCLIRKDINLLKSQTVEKNSDRSSTMTPHDRNMLDKMCHVLYNPSELSRLKQKYILTSTPKEDNKLSVTIVSKTVSKTDSKMEAYTPPEASKKPSDESSPANDTIALGNKEIALAEAYAVFGKELESLGVVYNLTFANYKQLMSKVFCQLSKRRFSEEVKPFLWVIQKNLPVDKNNVLVVDNSLSEMLDIMSVKGKMNLVELQNFSTNLSTQLKKRG